MEQLLGTSAVALKLGMSRQWVLLMSKLGYLQVAQYDGRRPLFRESDIEAVRLEREAKQGASVA